MLVDAELAPGDLAPRRRRGRADGRTGDLDVPALRARAAAGRARVQAAGGDLAGAIAILEETVDGLDAGQLPWLRATLLVDLARLREQAGDAVARIDARAAAALLATLDVVLARRPRPARAPRRDAVGAARSRAVRGATAGGGSEVDGSRFGSPTPRACVPRRAPGQTGRGAPRARPGRPGGRRGGGGARPPTPGRRRRLSTRGPGAYRERIEQLRGDRRRPRRRPPRRGRGQQAEIDQLVGHLAPAFGLGGRDRRAASAAERARLNVTRALRAAIARSPTRCRRRHVLDRRVRTGMYCVYDRRRRSLRWLVRSLTERDRVALNATGSWTPCTPM